MASTQGSSPHTRGALAEIDPRKVGFRIIPAYAGSTVRRAYRRHPGADHPRIRGEHSDLAASKSTPRGSSPHTRGAPGRTRPSRSTGRIIPAYAGSTASAAASTSKRADHPRIRGEHIRPEPQGRTMAGSSPHTRGARRPRPGGARGRRIIPAYAGSTLENAADRVDEQDHPRIRGEHMIRTVVSAKRWRIIPAYAGSTVKNGTFSTGIWDHPRIRGEHSLWHPTPRAPPGSSPHTRGARQDKRVSRVGEGIIPAYAGSTRGSIQRENSPRDHPRIRGEHGDGRRVLVGRQGSSPHTRGAQKLCDAVGGA